MTTKIKNTEYPETLYDPPAEWGDFDELLTRDDAEKYIEWAI